MRKHQPKDSQQVKGILKRSIRLISKRCILVVDKGTDSDHLRIQLLHESKILDDIFRCLPRCPDHDPAPNLIADLPEVVQTTFAVLDGELWRVKPSVMPWVGCFLPEQIPLCPGIVIGLILAAAFLPDGKRDRAVRMPVSDLADDAADVRCRIGKILPALQDKCSKAEFISCITAGDDLILRQTVPVSQPVAPPDPAVVTVISAVV